MGRVVHFEIHAADPARAAKFYSELFGWDIKDYGGPMEYWLITTGDDKVGINGAITKRMGDNPDPKEPTPVIAYVCTIEVADLDAMIKKVTAAGGIEALPKMPVPGIGWVAYYKDTESNIFCMMQNDPTAK